MARRCDRLHEHTQPAHAWQQGEGGPAPDSYLVQRRHVAVARELEVREAALGELTERSA